ncbi:MAG: hypothetical protein ABC595_00245 [Candidatus Methanosuratincola petrocarbonis]
MSHRASALKLLFAALVCGSLATFATGAIRNDPEVGLPEVRRYGYPLAWLVTDMNGPTQYSAANFALDAAFWAIAALLVLAFLRRLSVK